MRMNSSQIKHFDYIFTGTGLAALMTGYKVSVLNSGFVFFCMILRIFGSSKIKR